MKLDNDYVLGTHGDEIERLALQHRIWRPRMLDACMRAGLTTGQTVMDIGCGPGEASLDLAEIVGRSGKVVAIDKSERFLARLDARKRERELTQIETHTCNLDECDLPEVSVDGAWARWIFAFVRNPRELLSRVAARIKPGGFLVVHEYFHYKTWRLTPICPEFDEFVSAVIAAWRDAGGEPDIAPSLLPWLDELGFRVRCSKPLIDIVEPADFIWEWPKAFVGTGAQRLVDLGRVSIEEATAFTEAFQRAESRKGTRMITPAVLEIISQRV